MLLFARFQAFCYLLLISTFVRGQVSPTKTDSTILPADPESGYFHADDISWITRAAPASVVMPGIFTSAGFGEVLPGAELSLLFRTGANSSFMAGFYGSYIVLEPFEIKIKNVTYEFLAYTVGARLVWRKGKNIFLSVLPSIMLGKEKRTTHFYAGNPRYATHFFYDEDKLLTPQLATGVFWLLPAEKQGLYLSADLFVRGGAGTYFDALAGLKVALGARL